MELQVVQPDSYHFLARISAFTCLVLLAASPVWSQTGGYHGDTFNGLLGTVSSVRTGGGTKSVSTPGDDSTVTAESYYVSTLDPIVQTRCVLCHQESGAAASWNPPARILFTGNASSNHRDFESFVNTDGVGAGWVLAKIIGEENHGGARVVTSGSADYNTFAEYLELVTSTNGGGAGGGSVGTQDFWADTAFESRETTLRRAAFILSGTVPTKAAVNRAKQSDEALRAEVLKLMRGEGFHDFLVTGANDRLLTSGLGNGIDFQFDFQGRWPEFAEFRAHLPENVPDEFNNDQYWDKPFLTRNEAENEFRRALIQEPIELIAYIIENNRPYKEVVTADYTMVNAFSNIAYRAGQDFDNSFVDAQGFYDRSKLNAFKPGKNSGHIPHDQNFYWDNETQTVASFSGYQDWPHAGVLSTPAWLNRYPSTDTNRNRARSRWTYYHFLDFDIEKSAPRTQDPVALADTNNPTMNNPACTVCHVRMDPVAGSYQSFGDRGHYLDAWGAMDSLPDSYKHPERPTGEPSTLERDPNLDKEEWQTYTREFQISTAGNGGTFAVNDISPQACIQDEENSTEQEWVGWCSHLGVATITVRKNGNIVEEIFAADFEDDPRFAVDTWTDQETGEVHPRGWTDTWDPQRAVYFGHSNSWISFDLDLSAGDYNVEVELVTFMTNGHPENTVTAGLSWTEGYASAIVYQYGDTWYRDMRTPGFEGVAASGNKDSLQWLGQQIANDPRFPVATVKFWWPAIFGDNALAPPEDPDIPGYAARLNAYNEQQALIAELAAGFEGNYFRAKQLFADMIMSPWFRTSEMTVSTFDDNRAIELESIGSGRLLTPEELDRKNRAVFGRTWGERLEQNAHAYEKETNFSNPWWGYANFYGGIDGAAVTARNRELTSMMSNVSEKMAIDLSCQIVLEEFSKPADQRRILGLVEPETDPLQITRESWELLQSPTARQDETQTSEQRLNFTHGGGKVIFRFDDISPKSCVQDDERSTEDRWEGWCSHVGVESLSVFKGGSLVKKISGDEFEQYDGFASDSWTDSETGEVHLRGWTHYWSNRQAWVGHPNAWFEVPVELEAGDYEIRVNWVYWFNEGHPEDSVLADLSVRTNSLNPSSPQALQVAAQLDELYMTATHQALSDSQREVLMRALIDTAAEARVNGSWLQGHCDTWSLWGPREDDEFWNQLNHDPSGSKAGWTAILHSLLTSYSYLHD